MANVTSYREWVLFGYLVCPDELLRATSIDIAMVHPYALSFDLKLNRYLMPTYASSVCFGFDIELLNILIFSI